MATCPGIDRVIPNGSMVGLEEFYHHCQATLVSLPSVFGTTLETIPAKVPYLAADTATIERWRPAVEAIPGFRIGVTWRGNPRHHDDAYRSFRLADLAPLAAIPGVSLISIQKNYGSEQLADAPFPVADLGPEFHRGDWMDTAAVAALCDLVVTPDTAISHMAGATGRPTWVALSRCVEWRWLIDREDSPWYPTSRLFRQERLAEWRPVFRRMADVLTQELEHCEHRINP
jgi:hypothetical protein